MKTDMPLNQTFWLCMFRSFFFSALKGINEWFPNRCSYMGCKRVYTNKSAWNKIYSRVFNKFGKKLNLYFIIEYRRLCLGSKQFHKIFIRYLFEIIYYISISSDFRFLLERVSFNDKKCFYYFHPAFQFIFMSIGIFS